MSSNKDTKIEEEEDEEEDENKYIPNYYCKICKTLKMDKPYHCTSCNVCIDKYDHHCPWIGKVKYLIKVCRRKKFNSILCFYCFYSSFLYVYNDSGIYIANAI